MKRITLSTLVCLAMMIAVQLALQPAAAQGEPPPGIPVEVFVDPAPDQDWEPYTTTIYVDQELPQIPTSREPFIREAAPGKTDFVELDTLIAIYSNTAMGRMDATTVARIKEQVAESATFFWRNSHLKLHLNLIFVEIADYRDASEFDNLWSSCYWLMPYDNDGDGVYVEHDLLALGYTADQFDSINLFFGGEGRTLSPCAGGLAWQYWNWTELGFTQFTGNLVVPYWDVWQPFGHEFQHSIDNMFTLAGNPDYFHADFPQLEHDRFGLGSDFHATKMRRWPIEDWFQILDVWGNYRQVKDADEDGVPDQAAGLYINERDLSSDPSLEDTDRDFSSDRGEAMAGMWHNSNASQVDTDGDGNIDGFDPWPIYALDETIRFKSQKINGWTKNWPLLMHQVTTSNTPFDAALYASWDDDYLYLMLQIDRDSRIQIWFDAAGNGYYHDFAYDILLNPMHANPLELVHVHDCSLAYRLDHHGNCGYDDSPDYPGGRLVTENDLTVLSRAKGEGYILQLAIPRNEALGLRLRENDEIGLSILFHSIENDWHKRAWLFEEEDMVFLALHGDTSLTGQVTAEADGAPLPGILVVASTLVDDGWRWEDWVTYTRTDGSYEFSGLPESDYWLHFVDLNHLYATEYYDNAPVLEAATTIALSVGTMPTIDVQLTPAGYLSGTVTSEADGAGLVDIEVKPYVEYEGTWYAYESGGTEVEGKYTFSDLLPGTYRLQFLDYSGVFLDEYYDNAQEMEEAADIAVGAGTETTVNAQLALAGWISGTVTAAVDGTPVEALVEVYHQKDGDWAKLKYAYTDEEGQYTVNGLRTGLYRVGFFPRLPYARQYYEDAFNLGSAADVPVNAGSAAGEIDARLQVGAQLSGTVTSQSDGSALQEVEVTAYAREDGRWVSAGRVRTTADGRYTIQGLYSADYVVTFYDSTSEFGSEFYDGVFNSQDANIITVSIGQLYEGIDAALAKPRQPPNDDLRDAYLIPALPFHFGQTVVGATTADDDPSLPWPWNSPGHATVWFTFKPQRNMLVSADTSGSSYYAVLAVWQAVDQDLEIVASQHHVEDTLTLSLEAGETYYFEVMDPYSYPGILMLNITSKNTQPGCQKDKYQLFAAQTLAIAAPGVLGNDEDADGDPLTAVLVSDVAHGDLDLRPDGSFTYTPHSGYTGSDGFVYQASDGAELSESVTVVLTIAPRAVYIPAAAARP